MANEPNFDETQIGMIKNFGALHYTPELVSILLKESLLDVSGWMNNKKSVFYKHYNDGLVEANYLIDMKLFELAQNGDIKALEKYETRIRLLEKKASK